jgi:hypothetical protein
MELWRLDAGGGRWVLWKRRILGEKLRVAVATMAFEIQGSLHSASLTRGSGRDDKFLD